MKTDDSITFPLKKRFGYVSQLGLLLFTLITLGACSSDDSESPDDKSSLSVTIAENFSDPLKNINNIKVGDFIRYDIDIESQNEDATYGLNLNTSDEKGHRRLGKDYKAFFMPKDTLEKYVKTGFYEASIFSKYRKWLKQSEVTSSFIDIAKKGKYVLLLKPLLPGTFTHTYSFYEKIAGKKSPHKDIEKQINFNCVELLAWVQPVKTEDGSLFSRSKHHNEYYIRINDGDNENDKYLASQQNREQKYEIKYDGKTYIEPFTEGKDILFIMGNTHKKSAPEVKNQNIDKITIRQKDENRDEVVIEFYNVPLIIKSEI